MILNSVIKRMLSRREIRTAFSVAAILLAASAVLSAQDLESGAQTASDSLRRVFRIGATLLGTLGIVGGLITAAFKFFGKKEDATWWLVAAAGGAVIVTLALSLL